MTPRWPPCLKNKFYFVKEESIFLSYECCSTAEEQMSRVKTGTVTYDRQIEDTIPELPSMWCQRQKMWAGYVLFFPDHECPWIKMGSQRQADRAGPFLCSEPENKTKQVVAYCKHSSLFSQVSGARLPSSWSWGQRTNMVAKELLVGKWIWDVGVMTSFP